MKYFWNGLSLTSPIIVSVFGLDLLFLMLKAVLLGAALPLVYGLILNLFLNLDIVCTIHVHFKLIVFC